MWFSRRLGLVSGVMGLGTSAGIAILPQVYLRLIESVGWRNAYLTLGGATVGMLLPLVYLLFANRPEDLGQRLDGRPAEADGEVTAAKAVDGRTRSGSSQHEFDLTEAWRTRAYWIGLGIQAMWGMIGTAIVFNIVPLFEWQGLSAAQAAATFTTFAVCMAAMQLIGGMLADRLPLNRLLAISVSGLLCGVLVLWNMNTNWQGHWYAVLFGSSQGLLISAGNTFWARYFGRLHLGKIRSSVWTVTVAACSLGPFMLGFSIDYLGGYGPTLGVFSILLAGGAIAALFATPPKRPPESP